MLIGITVLFGLGVSILNPLGNHDKAIEPMRPKCDEHRHIGCIAPAGEQNAADARRVMAGIERVPMSAPCAIREVGLEPGVKIHRRRIGWHANVAEIAVAIARGNIQASAKGDREMGKIAADTKTFAKCVVSGTGWPGERIAEGQVIMYEIANRLHFCPAAGNIAEVGPGKIAEQIGFAIAAGEQKSERVGR